MRKALTIGKVDRASAVEQVKAAAIHIRKLQAERKVLDAENTLAGSLFCFTGKMRTVRHEIQRHLQDLGGQSDYSWSSSVDILVAADPNSNSIKIQKATRKGIPVISEDEFFKLIDTVSNGR